MSVPLARGLVLRPVGDLPEAHTRSATRWGVFGSRRFLQKPRCPFNVPPRRWSLGPLAARNILPRGSFLTGSLIESSRARCAVFQRVLGRLPSAHAARDHVALPTTGSSCSSDSSWNPPGIRKRRPPPSSSSNAAPFHRHDGRQLDDGERTIAPLPRAPLRGPSAQRFRRAQLVLPALKRLGIDSGLRRILLGSHSAVLPALDPLSPFSRLPAFVSSSGKTRGSCNAGQQRA